MADLAVILDEMEKKLFDEGRKEVFAVLMKDVKRIKAELAVIRERTVADQGYDTFKEAIIQERALEVMEELVTAEMEGRKTAACRSGDGDAAVARRGQTRR